MATRSRVVQNILGSKARVAVLREVIANPGITARQVAETSGMSWGAIRPAVEDLRVQGVIRRQHGKWSNGLYLDEEHILAAVVKELFLAEAELLRNFALAVSKRLKEAEIRVISVLFSQDENSVVAVCGKTRGKALTEIQNQAAVLGIGISFTSASGFNMHSETFPKDLEVITGESPPFSTLDDGLKFFGLSDE